MSTNVACWNHLPNEIWAEIFKYLDHYDIQVMRATCHHFKELLAQTKFMQNTKLVITTYNLTAIHTWLKRSRVRDIPRYENVDIKIKVQSKKLGEIIKRIGVHVKTLTLANVNVLNLLRYWCPNLNALTINYGEEEIKLRTFDLKNCKNLKSLELAGPLENALNVQTLLFKQVLANNVIKLERLQFIYMPYLQKDTFEILDRHASSLKFVDVMFCHRPYEKANILSGIFRKCCKMETIQLNGNCSSTWINAIFQSLPDEAPISNILLMGLYDIDSTIIENIVHRWPNTLAQFQMMISPHLTRRSLRDIGNLRHKLKKLDLTMCSIRSDALLTGIAERTNDVLQHLILDDNNALDEECIILLAQRLPNLKTFSLNSCRNGVTNTALNEIFKNQIKLESLSIDECTKINDEGLAGITRLKNLRYLSVRCCRQISDRSLCSVFFFKQLQTLRMGYCQMITVEGIEELVINCPVIKELEIISCFMVDDNSITHIVSKLPRLRILNVSNCINLTLRSVNDILDNAKSLRTLIMCGIDNFEIADAERKFKVLRPEVNTVFI